MKIVLCFTCLCTKQLGVPQRKTRTIARVAFMRTTCGTLEGHLKFLSTHLRTVKFCRRVSDGTSVHKVSSVTSVTLQLRDFIIQTSTKESAVTNFVVINQKYARFSIPQKKKTWLINFAKITEKL